MSLPPNVPACRHYHPNGLRCGSPAQRDSDFCYWHEELDRVHLFVIRPLDTAEGIQLGIQSVLHAMAMGTMKSKDAGIMLYGLQIAACNLRHMAKANDLQEKLAEQETADAARALSPPAQSAPLINEGAPPKPDFGLREKPAEAPVAPPSAPRVEAPESQLTPGLEAAARGKAFFARFTKEELEFLEEREKARYLGEPVPEIPPAIMAKIDAASEEVPPLDINACVDQTYVALASRRLSRGRPARGKPCVPPTRAEDDRGTEIPGIMGGSIVNDRILHRELRGARRLYGRGEDHGRARAGRSSRMEVRRS